MGILDGTFAWFTVVPDTGLVEIKVFLDAIWMVWGISVWFGWYLSSVGGIGLVYDGKRFWGGTWPEWGIVGVGLGCFHGPTRKDKGLIRYSCQ